MFQAAIPPIGYQPRNLNDSQTLVRFSQTRAITPFHLAILCHLLNSPCSQNRVPMPSAKASVPHNRKRQLSEADSKTDLSLQPTAKRQKLEEHRRHRTPSSFWDNLSRQWLTRRALREFDRRTVWPAGPVPPHRTGKENIDLAKLKRFARHGGPSLGDIRGVSSLQSFLNSPSHKNLVPRSRSIGPFESNNGLKSIRLQETSQDRKRIGYILHDKEKLCI